MSEDLYAKFGLSPIINAVGYATRVGGGTPAAQVIDAMTQAHHLCVEIDALQAVASERLQQFTGAQAGIITCGASAALALSAAACLAGNNPQWMDELPDTSNLPTYRIVFPKPNAYDYDRSLRLSGAAMDMVDYTAADAVEKIIAAITPATAAIGYVWKPGSKDLPLSEVIRIAHERDLPVIVDAALALPYAQRLREFVRLGADLVAVSGGKHLGGPQASGLLVGRRDLVRSAWVQMVDMDVRQGSWSLQSWIDEGWITRPPRHGIGRAMKVSKEAIIGCLTAIDRYDARDHAAERQQWQAMVDQLHDSLKDLPGLRVTKVSPEDGEHPYPALDLHFDDDATKLVNALRQHKPAVIYAEDENDPRQGCLYPICLKRDDVAVIVQAFRSCLGRS